MQVRQRGYQYSGAPCLLHSNGIQPYSLEKLARSNSLAYLGLVSVWGKNKLEYVGVNPVKLFTAVIYGFL